MQTDICTFMISRWILLGMWTVIQIVIYNIVVFLTNELSVLLSELKHNGTSSNKITGKLTLQSVRRPTVHRIQCSTLPMPVLPTNDRFNPTFTNSWRLNWESVTAMVEINSKLRDYPCEQKQTPYAPAAFIPPGATVRSERLNQWHYPESNPRSDGL
jgi:hypothetical protein